MKAESFTAQDLEYIKCMCEASDKAGLNWPRAVSLFPAQTEEEERWKKRMLLGITINGWLQHIDCSHNLVGSIVVSTSSQKLEQKSNNENSRIG